MRSVITTLLLPLCCILALTVTLQAQGQYIPGQLFVKVKNGIDLDLSYNGDLETTYQNRQFAETLEKYGIHKISKPFILDNEALQKTFLIEFDTVEVPEKVVAAFEQMQIVDYAEPVPLYEFFYTPNDLHINQWHLQTVQAELAWDITTGNSNVVIGLVDDAVLLSHEDIAPILWTNPGEIAGNGIDDDGNGYIDDINGWDAADNDNDPNPLNPTNSYFTHGTHCAGIAAAATDNNLGIASLSFNVSLMAVKIGTDANSSLTGAFQGVQYAIAAGADIISMSWGGGSYSQTFQNLFDQANSQGIILIAAAGNSNTTIPMYPAAYNNVISVGATNSSDQKASFSNYGSTIDVMAPGRDIWSCLAGSTTSYGYMSGTSMACPLVASLAALMLSWDASLSPADLEACLKSSSDNIDAQNPSYIGQIGSGRINAYQTLLCLKPITADFTSDFTQVCPGDTVQFTDLSNNNPTSWQWAFPGGTPSTSILQNPAIVYNTAGTYDATLIATNTDGSDTLIMTNYITVAVPTATISGSVTIPAGFSANLKVDLTGNPNWSITYSDGTNNFTVNNITNTPYYITVTPPDTTTYTLVSVSDDGCTGTVSGSAAITVINTSDMVCLTLQPDSIQGKDAEVFSKSGNENTNYGNVRFSRAWSWTFSSVPGDIRSFIEFDLSSIPQSATIINATLTLIHDSTSVSPFGHSTLSGSNESYLRRVVSLWDENTITWNNQPATNTTNQVILPQSDSIDQDYVIDATMLVQDMVNDPSNSHGFSLKLVTEQYYRSMTFGSSDNPDAFRWPKLEVCYLATGSSAPCLEVKSHQKISDTLGNFTGVLNNTDIFGVNAKNIGDLDGDGITDLAVGAQYDGDGGSWHGAVWILFMNTDGTVKTHQKISDTQGNFTGVFSTNCVFGSGIAPLGDLDGDGVLDIAVGARGDDDGGYDHGAVWILFLNTNGTVKSYQKISDTQGNFTGLLDDLDQMGRSITSLGDLDGDGIRDIAVGAYLDDDGGTDQGAVWILFLDTNGTVKSHQKISATQGNFSGALDPQDSFGSAVASIGDFDGDTYTDIAVGVGNDDDGGTDRGAVWILLLNSDGTVKSQQKISSTQGNFTGALSNDDRFGGSAIANIDDLNGDGITDLAVSAFFDDDGGTDRGAIWILYMNANGTVLAHQKISQIAGNFTGTLDNSDYFGSSIASMGDLDGDGFTDIAVGAYKDDDGGTDRGAVWILFLQDTCTNPPPCTRTFQKILGGSSGDWGSSVIQTADGGYIFTGGTSSFGAGGNDVYLVKTDANGDTMWTRTYGGTGTEYGHDIQQTPDGGYIIAGESNGLGAANADSYLIRTDINGNILWSKTYGGTDYDRSYAVDQTTDGGFILTGRTSSFGAGQDDIYLIKTDMNGDTLWTKTYGGTSDEVGRSVRQTNDGGYIITGSTASFGGGQQIYLVKTDLSGNVTWTKVFGGSFMEDGASVQQTSDGGYIITGFTVSYGAGSYDVILIKTDANGDMLWTKTYGGTGGDWGKTVSQTTDGGYIITGYTALGAGGFGTDVYLIKTDSIGDTLWTRTFGGTNNDRGNHVQQTSDGGYVIAAESQSFISGNIDLYMIKTDADGNSGCNQFSANTIMNTASPSVSSGVTVNNPATIVNNAATIVGNNPSNDSILCTVPCPIVVPPITCTTTFQKTFGGANDDVANAMKQTFDGGYIITGYTESFGNGGKDVILTKIDTGGNEVWSKTYGGTNNEEGLFVIQTSSDAGYIICGYTESFGAGGTDVYVIRTDVVGDTLWTKRYGGASNDRMAEIQQVNDGGFIMTSYTTSFGAGNWDVYLVKIDGNGTIQWTKTYGGFSADWANSIRQTDDMGYIIAGASNIYGGGTGHDAYVIKTDSLGNVEWSKSYGATFNNDGADVVALTDDGGYILLGNTWSYGAGGLDILLIKIDSVGNNLWTKTYGGTQNERGSYIETTTDGGFIFSCWTESFGAGSSDMLLVKTDNNGNIQWSYTFGGDSLEYSSAVLQTTDGGYAIAGQTSSFGAGGKDLYIVKFDTCDVNCNAQSINPTVAAQSLTTTTPSPSVSSGGTESFAATVVTSPVIIDSDVCPDTTTAPCATTLQKMLGGSGTDIIYAVQQTFDGGYILAGRSDSYGIGSEDLYLLKTDYKGDAIWAKVYGGGVLDRAYSMEQTADSGYIVLGSTWSSGAGNWDVYMIKTNSLGDTMWTKTYGGVNGDDGRAVHVTADGGYIIIGSTTSYGAGGGDMYLIKTDSNGDTLWTKTYGEAATSEIGWSVQQTADNGYIIAGYRSSGILDVLVVKTDSMGNMQWTKTYGGSGNDLGRSIQQTTDGGYILTGYTESFGAGGQDVYVLKLDVNGDTLWTKALGGTGTEYGFSVTQTTSGQYAIFGSTLSFGAGSQDYYLILMDSNGDTLWTKAYGGTGLDFARSVRQTDDGGFILGGYSGSFGLGFIYDALLIKTDADGYAGGCNEYPASTIVSNTATVINTPSITVGSGAIVSNTITVVANVVTIDTVLCAIYCDSTTSPINPSYCNLQADFAADTVCIGDSTSFTDMSIDNVTNIIIWRWYFGDGDSTIGVQNPKHLYSTADTFSVTLIISNDSTPVCFDTIVKPVVVLDTLFVATPPDDSICIGDSINLGPLNIICGNEPFTYNWSPGSSLNDSTSANPNAGPVVNTAYYVTVTDSQGVTFTDSITIFVDTGCCKSWALIGSDTNYCFGDTVFFTNNSIAKSGATFNWDFGPNATPASYTGANPPPVTFDTTGVIQIELILNDSCGIDTGYHNINIYPNPVADAGNDTSLCFPDSIPIGSTPLSFHTYSWAPSTGLTDTTIANPIANVTSSIIYVLTISNITSGCIGIDSITITLDSLPTAVAGNDTAICLGDSLQLNATGGISYNWTPSTGLSNDSIADPWASPVDTITYVVTVTDSNNCSGTDTITIDVKPVPIISISTDISICNGDSTQLLASGGITYNWVPSAGLDNDTIANPWASPVDTTEYSVLITDSNGCINSDSIIVSVAPIPEINATDDTTICAGDIAVLSAEGNAGYLWSTGDTVQSITVAPVSDSMYSVITGNFCGSDADSVWVYVNPLPIANAGIDQTMNLGEIVQLTGSGGTVYNWTPPDDLSCTNCSSPIATPENSVTYYLTVTDSLGCLSTDTVTITVDKSINLFIPDIFSPNGDDNNEVFFIRGRGIETLNLIIYDRWGEKVFERTNFQPNDENSGWNGKYKGELMNPAVFVYILTGSFIDGTSILEHGDFTLIR